MGPLHRRAECGRRTARYLKQHTRNDQSNLLIQNMAHNQAEQSLLLLQEQWSIVRVPGQMQQCASCTSQHIQTGTHRVGIVAQEADAMLIGHAECRLFGLFDERDQVRYAGTLQCNGACHRTVGRCQVMQQIHRELTQHLIFVAAQMPRKYGAQFLQPREWRCGYH